MNKSNDDTDSTSRRSAMEVDPDRRFERDVLPLVDDLKRRAWGYTRNSADAEDLVQETLLKAYKAFAQLRGDAHLRAWLLCIMRNTWISNHRTGLRRPAEVLIGDIAGSQFDYAAPAGSRHALSAEHQALRNVLEPDLAEALSALSEDARETVYHLAIRGVGCREAAEAMGVPVGTVLSRMHRARIKLRRSLGEDRCVELSEPRGLVG
jgi:RNA polymerase sigma-70 factor (ECF subfamily)